MIGSGVPAGANSANQAVASKPGKPASTMVGRSGDDGARVSEVTASGRTLPVARERQCRDGTGEHHGQATAEQIRHDSRNAAVGDMLDVDAGHGLVQLARRDAAVVPTPAEPKVSLPGCARRERGELGHALGRNIVVDDQNVGGEAELRDRREILDRLERQLRVEARMDDERPGGAEQEREPSGAALATRSVAMLPPEPATFSITTGLPQASVSLSPTTRATVSAGPPGTKPTRMRSGLSGELACANALPAVSSADSAATIPMAFIAVPRRFDRSDHREERDGRAGGSTGILDVLLCGAI